MFFDGFSFFIGERVGRFVFAPLVVFWARTLFCHRTEHFSYRSVPFVPESSSKKDGTYSCVDVAQMEIIFPRIVPVFSPFS